MRPDSISIEMKQLGHYWLENDCSLIPDVRTALCSPGPPWGPGPPSGPDGPGRPGGPATPDPPAGPLSPPGPAGEKYSIFRPSILRILRHEMSLFNSYYNFVFI